MKTIVVHRPSAAEDADVATLLLHLGAGLSSPPVVIDCLALAARSSSFIAAVSELELISPTSTAMLVIESITALLMLKNESVSSVFRALQLLLSRCDCYSHVILINHLESSDGSKSHFSFSDILDTLAVEVFTLETAKKNASDLALWADGWIIVDCFLLKASGSGGHGRIRKGSVKERVGIKLLDVVKKTTLSRRVSELVLEVKPEQTVHLGVNDRKPSGNVVFTPETNPLPNLLPVSSRNDPTSNLSFNLKLTNEQREMKEASVLPYVHTGEGIGVNLAHIGGFIHYEADANDDSEGDPDDDLAL